MTSIAFTLTYTTVLGITASASTNQRGELGMDRKQRRATVEMVDFQNPQARALTFQP